MHDSARWLIEISGTVQGVGFRPFVYRTALSLDLTGRVRNTMKGVAIEVQGRAAMLERFVEKLRNDRPTLAHIGQLRRTEIDPVQESSFVIESSEAGAPSPRPSIPPDIATCEDCLDELMSREDRRYRYPFTNCTNCGPRYTIIEGFPYDRPKTSMKEFDLCPDCAAEYRDPANRRFHAQPNACPKCGPRLKLVEARDPSMIPSASSLADPIERTLEIIRGGGTAAIKGLGGFHLACDATNEKAVARLRRRKHRDMKPFAVMVRDLDAAKLICTVSDEEADMLTSPRRPIVLLKKRKGIPIAAPVAPGNKYLGVMLPYTPLHHLLFESDDKPLASYGINGCHSEGGTTEESLAVETTKARDPSPTAQDDKHIRGTELALVMTSANFSDEPIIKDDDEAFDRLAGIADTFLTHNRPIHMRTDDSVVRAAGGTALIMRRARGYVPSPIHLPFSGPRTLALGGDIKNAFCISNGNSAYLSQHIGDLANAETHEHFERTVEHLANLLNIKPEIVACDMHPEYFSSHYARRHGAVHRVQHHHAHIASCMAEHGLNNEPVLGIALDGSGYGTDGTIWGGEVLRADYRDFERVACIKPIAQPGGAAAAREPWRMALSYLLAAGIWDPDSTGLNNVSEHERRLVAEAIEKDVNCPPTSSCGRLFDAVAALCGIATHNAYEGHAAMMLEQAAADSCDEAYPFSVDAGEGGRLEIDFAPAIRGIARDIAGANDTAAISTAFHDTVARAFARTSSLIGGNEPIVLTGGCMQNMLLLKGLTKYLEEQGRKVYTHRLVPPNDGGLALGQAATAMLCV
jgi:hydrogenase maturation protein HypF